MRCPVCLSPAARARKLSDRSVREITCPKCVTFYARGLSARFDLIDYVPAMRDELSFELARAARAGHPIELAHGMLRRVVHEG